MKMVAGENEFSAQKWVVRQDQKDGEHMKEELRNFPKLEELGADPWVEMFVIATTHGMLSQHRQFSRIEIDSFCFMESLTGVIESFVSPLLTKEIDVETAKEVQKVLRVLLSAVRSNAIVLRAEGMCRVFLL